MADVRRFELEELSNRPGTYFNPTTEVLIVVDDSTAIEAGLVEERRRGRMGPARRRAGRRRAQARRADRALRDPPVGTGPDTDDDVVEDEEELEPDPEDEF